jgi:NAD-dependent deacetylase
VPFHGLLAHDAQGVLGAVVTQNIDSLHHRSGVQPGRIQELHGHMRSLICADHKCELNPTPIGNGDCGFRRDFDPCDQATVLATVAAFADDVPACPDCGSRLRMETVMFGQPMPPNPLGLARAALGEADLVFVVGTSLLVAPANQLPGVALANGVPLVVVNLHATQFDEFATGVVRQPAAEFFTQVAAALSNTASL